MTPRIVIWPAAAIVGTLSAMLAAQALADRVAGIWLGILTALAAGLLGELARLIQLLHTRPDPRRLPSAIPADGRVHWVELVGARVTPNEVDPRLSRFEGWRTVGAEATHTGAFPAHRSRKPPTPPLLGKTAVVSIFEGADGKNWSSIEIARAYGALEKAGVWIENEARRFNQPVEFVLPTTYFVIDVDENQHADPAAVEIEFVPEGDHFGPFERDAETKTLIRLSKASTSLGFLDLSDWCNQTSARIEADVVVWLLHARRAGRSLAISHSKLDGVLIAVSYSRESSFPEPLASPPFSDPVTFAHELLHLFGASDKYGVPLDSFPTGTVTDRDVMRLSEHRLSRLRIDPRTADEIGWIA